MNALYHLLVIVVAAIGAIRGFRSGLSGQIAAVAGMAFGIVCAHLFATPVEEWLWGVFPEMEYRLGGKYFIGMLATALPFCGIFLLMLAFNGILRSAVSIFDAGMLDKLFGSAFAIFKYLFFLSILYNLMVDFNPRSSIVKYATDHDGNVVEAVMKVAPFSLGNPGVEKLAHDVQLEDAKKIS